MILTFFAIDMLFRIIYNYSIRNKKVKRRYEK